MIDKEKQEETYTPNAAELLKKFNQKLIYRKPIPVIPEERSPALRQQARDSRNVELVETVVNELVERQPQPVSNTHPAIADLVMADLRDRDQFGAKKYGTRLQPFNGRKSKVDLYQELIDMIQYARQDIFESEFVDRVVQAAITYVQHQDSNRVHDLFDILRSAVNELEEARKG